MALRGVHCGTHTATVLVPAGGDLDQGVTIANKFAAVHVRKVATGDGDRLPIRSLKMPYSIRLDARLLESPRWQDPVEFGTRLEGPFGPEPSPPQSGGASPAGHIVIPMISCGTVRPTGGSG